MAEDNRGQGGQEQTLDEPRRRSDPARTGTKRGRHTPFDASRHERGPALEVHRAHDRRETSGPEDEPHSRFAQRGPYDAGHKERCDAKLCDDERSRVPRRHESQQRCRRQNDADRVTGPNR